MAEKHFVKIYGCKRTGSYFIQTLLEQNCTNITCFDSEFGTKHTPPLSDLSAFISEESLRQAKMPERIRYFQEVYKYVNENKGLDSVIIIKNPYSWYRSIKEYTNRKTDIFNEQIFEEEYTHYNYMYEKCYEFYLDPQKVGHWYGKVVIVKYEDLLRYPKRKTKAICKELGIPVNNRIIVPEKVPMSKLFTKEQKEFYLGKSFGLSQDHIRAINKLVTPKVMKLYNYTRTYR
jgi:hypothetical protein